MFTHVVDAPCTHTLQQTLRINFGHKYERMLAKIQLHLAEILCNIFSKKQTNKQSDKQTLLQLIIDI